VECSGRGCQTQSPLKLAVLPMEVTHDFKSIIREAGYRDQEKDTQKQKQKDKSEFLKAAVDIVRVWCELPPAF
jgi:hypothetical protein